MKLLFNFKTTKFTSHILDYIWRSDEIYTKKRSNYLKNLVLICVNLWFYVLNLVVCNFCFAHGVNYNIIKGSIGIEVKYDDGSPMAQCDFKIFSPDGEEFQSGLTDKNGKFAFIPDKKGKWKIEVDDGLGHGIIKEIPISETLRPETSESSFHLWQKILIGISIIFGFTGVLFYFLTKHQNKP